MPGDRKAKEKEFKDLWIVTHLSSFYSRRWRKNNFLRKSPDDTKKEDNDDFEREDKEGVGEIEGTAM